MRYRGRERSPDSMLFDKRSRRERYRQSPSDSRPVLGFHPELEPGRGRHDPVAMSREFEGQRQYHYDSSNEKSRSVTPGAAESFSMSEGEDSALDHRRTRSKGNSHRQESEKRGNNVSIYA